MLEIVPDIAQSTHGNRNIFADIRNVPTRPHTVLGMFLLAFSVFPGRMTKPDPAQISRAQARDSQSTTASACAQVIGSERDSEKRRIDYFKRLMCKGEVSKAFRAIVSDAKVLPYSPDGLTFLQSKHPVLPSSSVPWDSDSGDRMEVEPLLVSFENVVSLIRSSSKGASCEVDNFPIDILKQLAKTVIKKAFRVDTRLFLEFLTQGLHLWTVSLGCTELLRRG
jgi:hypothetical protein